MNKALKTAATLLAATLLCIACNGKDPHSRGVAAGKAACDCYKLDGLEAIEACLNEIEANNQEFLTDTAYLNACEQQLLECITDGVVDIDKPIKSTIKDVNTSEKPDTVIKTAAKEQEVESTNENPKQ